MRHFGSLVLGLVLGALIYVLLAVSGAKYGESFIDEDTGRYGDLAISLVAVLAAAGLYALLVLARLSPLGLVATGLAFITLGVWSMFGPESFSETLSFEFMDLDILLAGPVNILIAVPLLFTVFSSRRWRRWGNAPAAVAPAPAYSPPPASPYNNQQPYSAAPDYTPVSPAYGTPVSPAYGSPEPSSPAGSYASGYPPPGGGYPPPGGGYPPPYRPDDPETTRRL